MCSDLFFLTGWNIFNDTHDLADKACVSPNFLRLTFPPMHAKQEERGKRFKRIRKQNPKTILTLRRGMSQCRSRLQPVFQSVSHCKQGVNAEGMETDSEGAVVGRSGVREGAGGVLRKESLLCALVQEGWALGKTCRWTQRLTEQSEPAARVHVYLFGPSVGIHACI